MKLCLLREVVTAIPRSAAAAAARATSTGKCGRTADHAHQPVIDHADIPLVFGFINA
jgi:hypothetical protein